MIMPCLVMASACGGAEQQPSSPPDPPPTTIPEPIAASADIHVTAGIPGAANFVTATLTRGAPLVVIGCVSSVAGACAATQRIVLDDDARAELEGAIAAVHAMPRCEPAGFTAGDPEYALELGGTSYTGHFPAAESQIAGRTAGPCLADARLAWWIARWIIGSSRAPSELPSSLDVRVDESGSEPRFISATVDLTMSSLTIVGCVSALAGSCRATREVALDGTGRARLLTLLEDVRAAPCHEPFPIGATLSITTGLVYDGPCGADWTLASWIARAIQPDQVPTGASFPPGGS